MKHPVLNETPVSPDQALCVLRDAMEALGLQGDGLSTNQRDALERHFMLGFCHDPEATSPRTDAPMEAPVIRRTKEEALELLRDAFYADHEKEGIIAMSTHRRTNPKGATHSTSYKAR